MQGVKTLGIAGQRFGHFIAIKEAGRNKWGAIMWLFRCDCGVEKIIDAARVAKGLVSHCTCLTTKGTHNKSKTKEYNSWCSIIARCENPNSQEFHRYGGRGIKICDSWRLSFETFLSDMGNAPSPRHSIDRINNNLGYFKENCRWATMKEQCRNRRTNNIIDINGEKKCLLEWCESFGISIHTFKSRRRRGVTMDKIFMPPRKMSKK